jgi:hypothetical protein
MIASFAILGNRRTMTRPSHFKTIKTKPPEKVHTHHPSLPMQDCSSSPSVQLSVNYDAYSPLNVSKAWNSDTIMHGIIHYIQFWSGNRYNRREMLLQCSGAQPQSDLASLLSPSSPDVFDAANGPYHCISITFHRIRIRPTALVLLSAAPMRLRRQLSGFVVHGFDWRRNRWIVIAEYRDWMPVGSLRVVQIDTAKAFSKFTITSTDSSLNLGTHFALAALEIHGSVIEIDKKVQECETRDCDEFDPWMVNEAE